MHPQEKTYNKPNFYDPHLVIDFWSFPVVELQPVSSVKKFVFIQANRNDPKTSRFNAHTEQSQAPSTLIFWTFLPLVLSCSW